MQHLPLIEALRQVPLFEYTKDTHLHTVADLGSEVWLEAGATLFHEGDPASTFYILLEGSIQITKRVGKEEVRLTTHYPGEFSGEISLLTGTPYSATGRALVSSRLMGMGREPFHQMLATCPNITTRIMQTMAQRIQSTEATTRQREKMFALGKLSAGLAHELNNPASATQRASAMLRETVQNVQHFSLKLSQECLAPEHMTLLLEMQREAIARAGFSTPIDAVAQCEHEDQITEWLDQHMVSNSWEVAATLVAANLDTAWLDTLNTHLPASALDTAIHWLAVTLDASRLIDEVEQSTARICNLVQSVKAYSFMDQAPIQETDIHDGIESTLQMLGHRLKESIIVNREYDRSLPRIMAYGSELNQVWMNLLDNALDALGEQGEITIRTWHENNCVLVQIRDNGHGIPADIQSRIFEPFFTTKGVGEGLGLGLDIVYRTVVNRHHGDIRISSQPGETCFQVWLPLQQ